MRNIYSKHNIGVASLLIMIMAIILVSLGTLISNQTWFHPEILGSSDYVWLYPGDESFFQILRKSLDWKAFDPNVNRVRPLNDFVEVIDAFSRPYISLVPGIRSSVALSTFALLFLIPIWFYKFLNSLQSDKISTRIFLAVFLCGIGFLSITVSYWHPAKRLSMLFTILALMAGSLWCKQGLRSWFWIGCLSVLASSLSDETGMANFLIFPIAFISEFKKDFRKLLLFLIIPILFLIISAYILPMIYSEWSMHGPWNALGDVKKTNVFGALFEINFWECVYIQTGRSIASSFGIWNQSIWVITGFQFLFILITVMDFLKYRRNSFTVPMAICFFISSCWATLLDWYPFPGQVSYLGSYNYYYHSITPILLIAWLASASKILIGNRKSIFLIILCFTIPLNVYQFININNVVRAIHQHPYTSESIELVAQTGNTQYLTESASESEKIIEYSLKNIFGNSWNINGFYQTHQLLKDKSLFTETHIRSLARVIVPFNDQE